MNFAMAATQTGGGDRITVFPSLLTFGILVVVVVELIVAGIFLKRKWLEKHEALPVPAALVMLFFMMSLYVLVGSLLYFSNSPQQRPPILFWLFVLYIPLGIQYALNLVNALVWQTTKRVSPVGDEVPTSPVLAQAQKLVRAGKIEEAVAAYTHFYERRAPALAEVARLLKTEGKVDGAKEIYVDLVENHASDRVVWPEAVYTLGKIYETHAGKAQEAIKLYKQLLDQAPESRFTHLAGADMARLMIMDASFIKTLNEDDDRSIPEDPFYAQRRNFLLQQIQQRERMAKIEEDEQEGDADAEGEDTPDADTDLEDDVSVNDDADPADAGVEDNLAELDVTVRGKTGIKKKPSTKKTSKRKTSAKKNTPGDAPETQEEV